MGHTTMLHSMDAPSILPNVVATHYANTKRRTVYVGFYITSLAMNLTPLYPWNWFNVKHFANWFKEYV